VTLDWTAVAGITAMVLAISGAFHWSTRMMVKEAMAELRENVIDRMATNYFDMRTAALKIDPIVADVHSLEAKIEAIYTKLEARVTSVETFAHSARHTMMNDIQMHQFRIDKHDQELTRFHEHVDDRFDRLEAKLSERSFTAQSE
jgi:regulator of sigma D